MIKSCGKKSNTNLLDSSIIFPKKTALKNLEKLMISRLFALSAYSNNKTNRSTKMSVKNKKISTQESKDELSISDCLKVIDYTIFHLQLCLRY